MIHLLFCRNCYDVASSPVCTDKVLPELYLSVSAQKREFPRSFSENIIAANTVSKGVRMPWWKDKKNKQREADPKDKKLGQSRYRL